MDGENPRKDGGMDSRYVELARTMVKYSTTVKPGDIAIVRLAPCIPQAMTFALLEEIAKAGGEVLDPWIDDFALIAAVRRTSTARSLRIQAASDFVRFLGADVMFALRGYDNPFELKGIDPKTAQLVDQISNGLTMDERINHCRWILTCWPTSGFAQLLGLPTPEAEDFFFNAVLVDYEAMARSAQPLVDLMNRTDQVHIVGPGTDLHFSIKDIPAVPCVGERNIPDGEVYTAPVRESMNGVIQYNTLTITKSGEALTNVRFVVKDGKIVEASCGTGDLEKMLAYLDTDEGARYFGEFAIGLNWGVTRVVGDVLFDEKVGGTFHLTPGRCYEVAPNGNASNIHWDIVCDQRAAAGGGEIFFDGVLVRENGIFTLPELAGLNPPGTPTPEALV
jgi:aminopeptidase